MLSAVGVLIRAVESCWRSLLRRPRSEPADPAQELRRKLAEARESESESAAKPARDAEAPVEGPETISAALAVAEEPGEAGYDLESYRRRVYERARALTEEMRGDRGR